MPHEKEQLILNNLGLVYHACKRYQGHCWYDDVCQEGMIGLIKAARTFDSSRGVKFSSYAIPFIKGEILHYFRDKRNIIRPSRGSRPYQMISTSSPIKTSKETREMIEIIPDKKLDKPDASIDINAAIKKLSLREQTIVRLHFFKGKPYRSIAKILSIHPASVARVVKRSIKKLAPLLAEYSDGCNDRHQQ